MTQPELENGNATIELLFERGVAAARGGKIVLATKLLRQVVKLDPHHEQAWLELSGVATNPKQIEFCLRAVLKENPANKRAKRRLRLLAQQTNQPTYRLVQQKQHAPLIAMDPWWNAYRHVQTTWTRVLRLWLLLPVVLIFATLAVRSAIELQPLPEFHEHQEISRLVRGTTPPVAVAKTTPTSSREALTQYFGVVEKERHALNEAVRSYRAITGLASSTQERIVATETLHNQVEQSYAALSGLDVPSESATAHAYYLAGLAQEKSALEQLLQFYDSNDINLANQAALQLQYANAQIAAATTAWNAYSQEPNLYMQTAGAE
jgi:hypothetical protein